jgi:hypothetical protein
MYTSVESSRVDAQTKALCELEKLVLAQDDMMLRIHRLNRAIKEDAYAMAQDLTAAYTGRLEDAQQMET